MNIIEKRVEEIKEDLEFFDDELAKYEYIIDLGKRLESFKEEESKSEVIFNNQNHQLTSDRKTNQGPELSTIHSIDSTNSFDLKTDTIPKQIEIPLESTEEFIIEKVEEELTIEELKQIDMDIVHELKLSEVITPNRQSGVIGMMKKIKEYALKA